LYKDETSPPSEVPNEVVVEKAGDADRIKLRVEVLPQVPQLEELLRLLEQEPEHHRVYRNFDPRAKIVKEICHKSQI